MAKSPSLKLRSYLLSILVVGGVWSVTAWFSYQSSSEVVHRLIDEQLRHEHELLRRQVEFAIASYDRFQPDLDRVLWDTEGKQINRAIIFWNDAGDRMVASVGAPEITMPDTEGYSTLLVPGPTGAEAWRVLHGSMDSGVNTAVLINQEAGEEYIREIGIGSLRPLFIAIVISALGVVLGFTFGWRPLMELMEQVSVRSPKALDPIPTEDTPSELVPFIDALNGLMMRLQRALDLEHQFTANAAHELQTPLAAIKTEVQLCQRRNSDAAVADMLNRIEERVDRATNMVKQLLMLARLEASDQEGVTETIDLNSVIVDSISGIAHLLIEQDRDIEFNEGKATQIQGNRQLLEIMVKNLLDNALLYSTTDGRIQVLCNRGTDGRVELSVANESTPVSAQQREKMLETFYRIPGSGAKGSGLGLSIVQRIAEMHEANLRIESWHADEGLKISIIFIPDLPESGSG